MEVVTVPKVKGSPYLTTFDVSAVEPMQVAGYNIDGNENTGHLALQLSIYEKAMGGEILQGTTFPTKNIQPTNNGFVDAVTKAYNEHHHVILRPDDVWLSIMTQFSFYLNARAEELRSKFVNFEGKKKLTVTVPGVLRSAPYDLLVNLMEAEIHKNLVDPEVRSWIMPNFSTTTPEDTVVAGVVFMAAMKKYFEYFFCLTCGIPSVTLDGTVEDWEDIRRRLDKLDTYHLNDWGKLLKPILDEFVLAKKGKPNKEFWTRVCHYENDGSGPTYLCGWITTFCLFDEDGKMQGKFKDDKEWALVETIDIPSGVVQVDVIVNDNGTKYDTVMLAGSMGMEIKGEGKTLQPRSGWVIALKRQDAEEVGNENA